MSLSSSTFAQDSDGDGVPDAADAFPCDPSAAAEAFGPAEGQVGVMLFEDLWPAAGDLDFNDVVISFHYRVRLNAAGEAVALHATFDPLALGGTLDNGLGLRLPVSAGGVTSLTRSVGGRSPELVPTIPGEAQLAMVLSPNLRELFGMRPYQINSLPDQDRITGELLELELRWTDPVSLPMGSMPFDLFVFRADDPTHELHRPEHQGTVRMNTALFNTQDDSSSAMRAFVDQRGLPFALVLPASSPYPAEGVSIDRLYPRIVEFASFGGTSAIDFYTTHDASAAYRDRAGLGPLAGRIATAQAPIDQSCFAPVLSLGDGTLTVAPISDGSSAGACTAVTLSNISSAAASSVVISLTGTEAAHFELCNPGSNACGTNLAAGTSCQLGVRLLATSGGTFTATLNAGSSEGAATSRGLSGTASGHAPILSLGSGTFAVSPISAAASPGACTSVQLSNIGTATANGLAFSLSGAQAAHFQLCAAPTSPCASSLAVAASCNLGVRLLAQANGTFTATLNATSVEDASASRPVSGTASGFAPVLSLGSGTLTVGAISGGSSPGACTVVALSNTGNATATGIGTSFGGAHPGNFELCAPSSNACGSSLAAGASCNYGARLVAGASGTYTTTLNASSVEGASASRALSGSAWGFGPILSLGSDTLTVSAISGGVSPGACTSVALFNLGSGGATGVTASIAGPDAAHFQLCSAPSNACGSVLAAGASCMLGVRVVASSNGAHGAVLRATSNEGSTAEKLLYATSSGFPGMEQMIVTGGSHSCVLLSDGTVRCWGDNTWGYLGDGSTTERKTPGPVTNLNNAVKLTAGAQHTCAVLADGSARCWGSNGGRLGNASIMNSNVPVAVSNLTQIVDLSAGGQHTCAARADGTAWCWGNGVNGRLGDGTTSNRTTPNQVPGLSGVTRVAAGGDHSCAVLANGTAYCWGRGSEGQLGSGGTTQQTSPVQVSGLTNAVDITAGDRHTCALLNTGGIQCWGWNYLGRLGDGSTTQRTTPVNVTGITGASMVHAGGGHTCALVGGGMRCWGSNFDGQLGDNTTSNRSTSVAVSGLSGVTYINAGGDHTCAMLSNGTGRCWGNNSDGQVGDGTINDRSLPTAVPFRTPLRMVAAGEHFSCGVLEDGSVRCWGYNNYGQLGDGTTGSKNWPTPVIGVSGATKVSVGYAHACALTGSTVRCWGYNASGQLGDGTSINRSTSVAVNVSSVVDVAAGRNHTCVVHSGGTVSCWGNGGSGQIGSGTSSRSTPGLVSGISGATRVSAGGWHTCVLRSNSYMTCFGDNTDGQTNTTSPVVAIDLGREHTCAVMSSGSVRCWGDNYSGQVMPGLSWVLTSPTTVTGVSGVVEVSAGDHHTCARSAGGIQCWGLPDGGRLGNGSTGGFGPVWVSSITSPISVSAGEDHSCAVVAGGKGHCWGQNYDGQFGNDTQGVNGHSNVPVPISLHP